MRETEFLRLKRSKLGVEDFEPLKVIGRGAFGEVRQLMFCLVNCKADHLRLLNLQKA